MTRGNWLPGQPGHDVEHNHIDKLLRERTSASNCGIKGDGTTDDTAAIQAAINAVAGAGGGELWFPNSIYKTTAPITLASNIKLTFASRGARIVNAVSDVFSGGGSNIEIAGGLISASAGHIFALNSLGLSHIHDCSFTASHPNKSIYTSSGSYIGNVVERCHLEVTAAHTVPAWYHQSDGDVNQNVWRDCQCYYSGNYVFWIEDTGGGAYAYDNRFESVLGEFTTGGFIKLLGCFHATIANCHEYDLHVATINRDLIYLGKHATGTPCRNVAIRDCGHRSGNVYAANVYDINLDHALNSLVENCCGVPAYKTRIGVPSTGTVWINDGERGTILP